MILAALLIMGVMVRGMVAGLRTAAIEIPGWEALLDPARTAGPGTAAVRIVEFSDFQCPYCAKARADLRRLEDRYPGQIAVMYRHLPLERIHPHALSSALASECARSQGRFQEFHDVLFDAQERIGRAPWTRLAADAGVRDTVAFQRCLQTRAHQGRVADDVRQAKRLGISGTPAFIVEGRLIAVPLSSPVVDSLIRQRLGRPSRVHLRGREDVRGPVIEQ